MPAALPSPTHLPCPPQAVHSTSSYQHTTRHSQSSAPSGRPSSRWKPRRSPRPRLLLSSPSESLTCAQSTLSEPSSGAQVFSSCRTALTTSPASLLPVLSSSVSLRLRFPLCRSKSCYDILPESFRLIVLDNKLSITRSLTALVTNGEWVALGLGVGRLSEAARGWGGA